MKHCERCSEIISNYPCKYCGHGEYEPPDTKQKRIYDDDGQENVTEVTKWITRQERD